jgi:hypothetical protein
MAAAFFAKDGIFSPPSNLKGEGEARPETAFSPGFGAHETGAESEKIKVFPFPAGFRWGTKKERKPSKSKPPSSGIIAHRAVREGDIPKKGVIHSD